jgi:hypothetical protein
MSDELTWRGARPRRLVQAFNALSKLGSKLRLAGKRITPGRVVRAARRSAGHDDLGGDVEDPLERLCESFDTEARLSPFGRFGAHGLLVAVVAKRLRIVARLAKHAEIHEEEVRKPLFVIGLPRTGTTLLLNLLAADPAARPLLGWEAFQPVPPKRAPVFSRHDPRLRQFRRAVKMFDYFSPDLQVVHPIGVDAPEECLPLLMRTLTSWAFLFYADLRSYEEWLWERSRAELEEAYRFYRSQLQFLQRQRRGGHWVLKSPAHQYSIHALARVFPDACIVQTHRHLRHVVPSSCSLLAVARSIMSDEVNARELGRRSLESAEMLLGRMETTRAQVPAERRLDLRYDDLVADPIATVHRIYAYFGYERSEEHDERMRAWLAENPRNKRGVHRYSLEQFGLKPADIDWIGSDYHARHDLR